MTETLDPVDEIVERLRRRGEHLLLVTGFDGVLVDYQPNPGRVWLPVPGRERLADSASSSRTTLAVISGRRVADLRARIGIDAGVFYIGLHGLEIDGPGFTRTAEELIERYGERIHDIANGLVPSRVAAAGVRFEDKGAAVAVHTREAGPVDTVWARLHVLNAAADLVSARQFRVLRGNHVFELVPNVPEPRANAVRTVRQILEQRDGKPVLPVYIGEDVRDDDVFDAMNGEAVTIAVGGRARRAHHQLRSPADVTRLLTRLAQAQETQTA